MCGRYTLTAVKVDFAGEYGVVAPPDIPVPDRYNIAPTQPVLIVREDRETGTGRRELAHVVWGLIPPWADSPSIGSKMINARSETASEKPAFRNALKRRRCLVPATGFYEWRQAPNGEAEPPPEAPRARTRSRRVSESDLFAAEAAGDPEIASRAPGGVLRIISPPPEPTEALAAGPGTRPARKVPHYFSMKRHRPFAFAGLWEVWTGPHGELLESCTILTTKANDLVAPVHERMPVILPPEAYDLWLDPMMQDPREVQPLLRPFDPDRMQVHPVSPRVNSPGNDGPELIEPA